jgi:hypothetical protein
MRGIVVALVVAGLRVSGARRNVACREIEKGCGNCELHPEGLCGSNEAAVRQGVMSLLLCIASSRLHFSAQVQMEAIA